MKKDSSVAPIVLFVYSRLDHVKRTVDSLLANTGVDKHDLIVFSDAAKSEIYESKVCEVREYLKSISGFHSVSIHLRSKNFGLSQSIIQGLSEVFSKHDRAIILEDDIVTSRHFLNYMNDSLGKYADDERVVSVHGYMYPVRKELPEAFFLRGADCWGWATWRRGWSIFNPDGKYLLDELLRKKLTREFDCNGAYKYTQMLEDQISGKNDSWAIRWHASAFLANKLTLYPGRSLVHNIGNDGSGTHCDTTNALDANLSLLPITLSIDKVEESVAAILAIEDFFKSKKSFYNRVIGFVKRIL